MYIFMNTYYNKALNSVHQELWYRQNAWSLCKFGENSKYLHQKLFFKVTFVPTTKLFRHLELLLHVVLSGVV